MQLISEKISVSERVHKLSFINENVIIVGESLMEYPENYFDENNLLNTNYHKIKRHDFSKFLVLMNKNEYDSKIPINIYQKIIFGKVLSGTMEVPIILKGINDIFWSLYGENQLLAYKILGISPLIKQIEIDTPILKEYNEINR